MQAQSPELALAEFVKRFQGKARIAPFAMNIQVLIQSLADADLDYRQLATVIHHYPVITARIIALANSAWTCPATPITTIEAACIRLGHSVVKSVSIALAVASSFNIARCPVFNPMHFWTSTMLVAEASKLLATKLPSHAGYPVELLYTAQTGGILHALGLLWLADNLATETSEALQHSSAEPLLTVSQALIDRIGIDYCSVGAWIGKQWQMPEELICVMQHHRDDPHQADAPASVILVGAAAKMSSSLICDTQEFPDYPDLHALGIDSNMQKAVMLQIAKKLDTTKELAKTLFL